MNCALMKTQNGFKAEAEHQGPGSDPSQDSKAKMLSLLPNIYQCVTDSLIRIVKEMDGK
jgi:hypothetical protein